MNLSNKRYIFVGDIHGCYKETVELIEAISPGHNDVVVSLGDFVDRGPDPDLCIELWIRNGYKAVLGNHDNRIVDWFRGKTVPEGEDLVRSSEKVGRVHKYVDYLANLPLFLDFECINTMAVHGAIDINKTHNLMNTDENIALRGRLVRRIGTKFQYLPLDYKGHDGNLWSELWQGPKTVVYGHTPQRLNKPKIDRFAIGIDTGCAYGGNLTAAVFSQKNQWSFFTIAAHDKYWTKSTKEIVVI